MSKNGSFRIFYKKYSTYAQKRSSVVLSTKFTGYVEIKITIKIKPRRYLSRYSYKNHLTNYYRKFKASSINWLFSKVSLTPTCFQCYITHLQLSVLRASVHFDRYGYGPYHMGRIIPGSTICQTKSVSNISINL